MHNKCDVLRQLPTAVARFQVPDECPPCTANYRWVTAMGAQASTRTNTRAGTRARAHAPGHAHASARARTCARAPPTPAHAHVFVRIPPGRTHPVPLSGSVQTGAKKQIIAAQSALTQLILFCTKSQDVDPLTRTGVPITQHQLLLLDTNVHILVIQMLSAPFKESMGPAAKYSLIDLENVKNAELCKLCALGYRLLRQMVYGSPAFAFTLAKYIPFIQSQLGYCRLAADTLSEMFHNNRKLLDEMPERLVNCFVQLCTQRVRQAGYGSVAKLG